MPPRERMKAEVGRTKWFFILNPSYFILGIALYHNIALDKNIDFV